MIFLILIGNVNNLKSSWWYPLVANALAYTLFLIPEWQENKRLDTLNAEVSIFKWSQALID